MSIRPRYSQENELVCAWCDVVLRVYSNHLGEDVKKIEPGIPCICFACSHVSILDDDKIMRRAETDELDSEVVMLCEMIRELDRRE
jgi:hypothetical protein